MYRIDLDAIPTNNLYFVTEAVLAILLKSWHYVQEFVNLEDFHPSHQS